MDWSAIGTAVGGLVLGAGGVGIWWRNQAVNSAASGAQVTAYDMLNAEVKRMGERIGALEQREGRLIRHIYRLEAMLRAIGQEPPTFDVESDGNGVRL